MKYRLNHLGSVSFGSFAQVGDLTQPQPQVGERLFLAIEVGEYCQLACRHCIYHNPQGNIRQGAPRTSVIHALKGFLSEGQRATYISFAGKEPTVYPDELLALAQATRQNELVILMTNGLLLRDQLLEALERHIGQVDISIDGDASAHDWMRGSGMFERTMTRVEEILQRGHTRVGLIATAVNSILTDGRRQVDSIVSLAKQLHTRFGDNEKLSLSVSLYYDRPNHPMLLRQVDLVRLCEGLRHSQLSCRVLWTANYAYQWASIRDQLDISGVVRYDTLTNIPVVEDGNVRHLLFNLAKTHLAGIRVANDGSIHLGCNHLTLGHEAGQHRLGQIEDGLENIISQALGGGSERGLIQQVSSIDGRCETCPDFVSCGGGDSLSGVYFTSKPSDPYCPRLNNQ